MVASPNLLYGNETRLYGDSAYTGKNEVLKQVAPKARYRGLVKNANRAFVLLALINLDKWGLPLTGQARPA